MLNYQVGSNVDSWCTRCKLILAHTIEAIAQGNIKRVQCNTCRGAHQYKGNEPGTKKISLSLKSSSSPKARPKASDLERLLQGKNLANALPYSIGTHFAKGDVINHANFGQGVVLEDRDTQKIEVLFESGPKILIHARS
jgi:hypothetical protein